MAVGTDHHVHHVVGVAIENRLQSHVGQVPESEAIVVGTCQRVQAVRGEGHRVNAFAVALQYAQLGAVSQIPQNRNPAVERASQRTSPVRADGEAERVFRPFLEALPDLAVATSHSSMSDVTPTRPEPWLAP